LRILYLPLYTSQDITGCSTFLYAKTMYMSLIEKYEDIFLYFPVPEVSYPSKEIEHPRIMQIPIGNRKKQRDEMRTYDRSLIDLFSENRGKYFIDIVLCDKQCVASQFMNELISYTTGGSGGILLFNNIQFVLDKKHNGFIPQNIINESTKGVIDADLNLMTLNNDLQRILKEARSVFSASSLSKIIKSSKIKMGSIDIDRIDNANISVKKNEEFTVNWGYGLNSDYNFEDVFQVIDSLFCSGRKVKILICTPGGFTKANWKMNYRYFEMMVRCPQEEFWSNISKAHCFVYMAGMSELSYSVLEQQYLGLVGVFLNRPYLDGWLYEGYPFIAKDKNEIAFMLRDIYNNYESDRIQDVIKKQKDFIKKYSKNDRVDTLYQLFKERYDAMIEDKRERYEGIPPLLISIFKDIDGPITYEEFKKLVAEGSGIRPFAPTCKLRVSSVANCKQIEGGIKKQGV